MSFQPPRQTCPLLAILKFLLLKLKYAAFLSVFFHYFIGKKTRKTKKLLRIKLKIVNFIFPIFFMAKRRTYIFIVLDTNLWTDQKTQLLWDYPFIQEIFDGQKFVLKVGSFIKAIFHSWKLVCTIWVIDFVLVLSEFW